MLEAGTPSLEMEKRIFVAVLISLAFLWLWAAVAPKLFPELVKKPVPVEPKAATTTTPPAGKPDAVQPVQSAPPPSGAAAPATTSAAPAAAITTAPLAAPRVIETTLAGDGYVARFSNRGAELVSFRLPGYKMHDRSAVDLVKAREPERTDFPFAIEAP